MRLRGAVVVVQRALRHPPEKFDHRRGDDERLAGRSDFAEGGEGRRAVEIIGGDLLHDHDHGQDDLLDPLLLEVVVDEGFPVSRRISSVATCSAPPPPRTANISWKLASKLSEAKRRPGTPTSIVSRCQRIRLCSAPWLRVTPFGRPVDPLV